jgi:preprotein translocase subunit SecE
VARDRQRAKQRRAKRRPDSGGSRSTRDVERELGLGGDEPVESPLGEGTAAPDPLEHASADVDLARLAEAGAPLPEDDDEPSRGRRRRPVRDERDAPAGARDGAASVQDEDDEPELASGVYADELEGDDEFERAPDEAEGDAPVRRRAGAVAHGHERERERGRVITFLRHCVDELRRVQWPDRRHVGQATAVVLGFVVLAGGYLGLLDAIWRPLVEAIL